MKACVYQEVNHRFISLEQKCDQIIEAVKINANKIDLAKDDLQRQMSKEILEIKTDNNRVLSKFWDKMLEIGKEVTKTSNETPLNLRQQSTPKTEKPFDLLTSDLNRNLFINDESPINRKLQL